MERFTVANLENWGNLVKSWAKGDKAWPTSLQEFKDQCAAANVGASVPDYVTAFQLVQAPSESTLLLRIPPRKFLEDSEAALNAGASYTIPDFYGDLFKPAGAPTPKPNIPAASNMKVHALRIGDYTMSACQ
jgi:hypothetical protein